MIKSVRIRCIEDSILYFMNILLLNIGTIVNNKINNVCMHKVI